MTVLSDYVARMVSAGVDQEEAFQMVAEIFAAGAANASARSSNAVRQQRYRDRQKRNESVTKRNADEGAQTVTNRNETVTSLRSDNSHISYLSSSIDIQEKKESKKERQTGKRNAPLPDDWHPTVRSLQIAEEHGVNAQLVEQIFRDYLKSSGKLYADYDAAFNNFIRNQRKFNGNSGHARPKSAVIQAADNLVRKLASFDGPPRDPDELRSGEGEAPPRLLSNG